MLECSREWSIRVGAGTKLQKLKAQKLQGSQGMVLVGSHAGNKAVILKPNRSTHEAFLMTAPDGEGHAQWIIRIPPGIATASSEPGELRIHADADNDDKHIVAVELLLPGETAFAITPVVPTVPRADISVNTDLETPPLISNP